MAGGLLIVPDNNIKTYNARLTWQVVLTCIVASTGGLLFGWGSPAQPLGCMHAPLIAADAPLCCCAALTMASQAA
jgi:hypothetical protein